MEETPPSVASAANQERNWVTGLHFSALSIYIGIPLGSILAPLVIWLMKKDSMPAVDAAGKSALNFNISILIYYLVAFPAVFILIGIPLMIAIFAFHVIFTILAGLAANKGDAYSYPLAIRFIR